MSLSTVSADPTQQFMFVDPPLSGEKSARKTLKQALKAIDEQIKKLSPLANEVIRETPRSESLGKKITDISTALSDCEGYLSTKTQHHSPTNDLNQLASACSSTHEKLKAIAEKLKTEHSRDEFPKVCKAIQDEMRNLIAPLKKHRSAMGQLSEKAKLESDRLKKKIDLDAQHPVPTAEAKENVLFRLRKIAPGHLEKSLEESLEKEAVRKKHYHELKSAWEKVVVTYNEMDYLAAGLKVHSAIGLTLQRHLNDLNQHLSNLHDLEKDLHSFSVATLAKTFVEKSEIPRLLTSFIVSSNTFMLSKQKLEKAEDYLSKLSLNKKFHERLLKELSDKIQNISEEKDVNINLEDGVFKATLTAQRENAKIELMKKRDDLENLWNTTQIRLIEIKDQLESLKRTHNFIIQSSHFYLAAEGIREVVRLTRKHEPSRDKHVVVYNEQKTKFDTQYHAITTKNDYSLKTNYQKSLFTSDEIQALKKPSSLEDANAAGFICLSTEKEKEIIAKINAQKVRFAEWIEAQNADIKAIYETHLPKMYSLATEEVNRMGLALETETREYDNCFNRSYERENPLGRMVEALASGAASKAKNMLTVALSNTTSAKALGLQAQEEAKKEPYIARKSPFEITKTS